MPFHNSYLEYINKTGSDLCNTGGRWGGSCTAAIFLKQFVDGLEPAEESEEHVVEQKQSEAKIAYAHIDIVSGSGNIAGSGGSDTMRSWWSMRVRPG